MQRINQGKNHEFPKTQQAWARFINSLHDDAISDRRPLEFSWARNIAYYRGYQNLLINPISNLLQTDLEVSDEFVINKIASFVETRVAKLTRSRPILTVIPDKLDPLTIKAAELSETLLKHLWKVQGEDEKVDDSALLMILCGTAFQKVIWNPKGGEPIREDQDQEGNVIFDSETGQQKQNITFLGDIETFIKSPFSILTDIRSRKVQDAVWIIDRSYRTVDELIIQFPDMDVDRVLSNKQEEMTQYERFVINLGSPVFSNFIAGSASRALENEAIKDHELVLVKEFWMKPNRVYPKGVLATVVSDQLLQFDSWPYEHMEYPFVKMEEHKNPFGFYGTSTIERLIPIQRHYNEARSQIAKNAAIMANIKWWVPKGSGLSEDALTDEEGEVVQTNPTLPRPEQLGIMPLPNYVIENLRVDNEDFRTVGSVQDLAQAPFANLTAGVALETATEIADLGLIPSLRNMERAFVSSGRQKLMLANQYYTDERTVRIIGQNGRINIVKFKNLDLQNQTDVTVQLESAIGQTKGAQQQKLVDLWDRRIITDPDKFMKAFVTGDIDLILKEKDPAENVVIEEIENIKQGAQPPVMPFDNHILHIRMLTQFLQTPEFRRMPEDRQQIAIATLQQHLAFIQPAQEAPQTNPAAVGTPFGAQVPEGA